MPRRLPPAEPDDTAREYSTTVPYRQNQATGLGMTVEEVMALGSERRGWCKSCNKYRSDCFKWHDWICYFCGNHNYAQKVECWRRSRERPTETYTGSKFNLSRGCPSHRCPMSECFKLFDWLCRCGGHNFAGKEDSDGEALHD